MVPLIHIKTQLRELRYFSVVTECLFQLRGWLLLVHLMEGGHLTQTILDAHVSIYCSIIHIHMLHLQPHDLICTWENVPKKGVIHLTPCMRLGSNPVNIAVYITLCIASLIHNWALPLLCCWKALFKWCYELPHLEWRSKLCLHTTYPSTNVSYTDQQLLYIGWVALNIQKHPLCS